MLCNINIIIHWSQHSLFCLFCMFVVSQTQIFTNIPPLEAEVQQDYTLLSLQNVFNTVLKWLVYTAFWECMWGYRCGVLGRSVSLKWRIGQEGTLSPKYPSAWYFVRPAQAVTCGTVAIKIRVVLLSPYWCIRGVSLSSIHYNQSHRAYINRKQK